MREFSQARGFTLIELLVVIATIGILASIVLVSLSGARGGANDAHRVAEMRNMVQTLLRTDIDSPSTPLTGTVDCVDVGRAPGCTLLAQFSDPSGTALCSNIFPRVCQYTIRLQNGGTLSTSNFKICAYLERGSGSMPQGNISINSATYSLQAGCL